MDDTTRKSDDRHDKGKSEPEPVSVPENGDFRYDSEQEAAENREDGKSGPDEN
ncbi:hypothetical protein GRZ55_13385 [Chelativorans sp. ZYF759]|uniref:hypothetical protein n=1 Tax=Chelativorans sp. ZYF759 TaxID=2692213 RepID=UPI00145D3CAD|nr:hypothetical protein [Chelativorans sp. ZYF759]NMG40236.1 hypothetical protein [Chelativorans sp. ZYF759]